MDYSLAKQLKDAGFPFKKVEGFLDEGISAKYGVKFQTFEKGMEEVYIEPTLSELIEACGDYISIEELSPDEPDIWGARKRTMKNGGDSYYGSTPEEAVSKLWLELNNKDTI